MFKTTWCLGFQRKRAWLKTFDIDGLEADRSLSVLDELMVCSAVLCICCQLVAADQGQDESGNVKLVLDQQKLFINYTK